MVFLEYLFVVFVVMFVDLQIYFCVLWVIGDVGYELLMVIQVVMILVLMVGFDVVGLVQIGIGKMVVFVILMLFKIDIISKVFQVLVLVFIWELVLQVVEVFGCYGVYLL